MSYVQLSEGGFQVVYVPPWLVVPVLRSCQSPTWIWLVNYLHLHLHLQLTDQAPGTIESAAQESRRTTATSTAAVHASSTATTRHHYPHPTGSSPDTLSQRSLLRSTGGLSRITTQTPPASAGSPSLSVWVCTWDVWWATCTVLPEMRPCGGMEHVSSGRRLGSGNWAQRDIRSQGPQKVRGSHVP